MQVEASRAEIVRRLQQELDRSSGARGLAEAAISSGCDALDRLLPEGGFPPGSLVQWLGEGEGSGAGSLALLAAVAACQRGGSLVVLDRHEQFYPPAARAFGVPLEEVIVIRARHRRDETWALDQALRCPAVAAVWAPLERLDWRAWRRLQLAAEAGGGVAHLVRQAPVRNEPLWSAVQLRVRPLPSAQSRRLQVELLRCRGVTGRLRVELELDEWTGVVQEKSRHEARPLRLATRMAPPARPRRSAGA